MAVIPLPNVAPQGPSPVMEWGSKTFNEEFESPFTGQQQTYGNGANVARQSARLTFENLHSSTNAPLLKRFLLQARGRANRFFLPDYSHTIRGSFPATELLTNNHFASGTTGWSTDASTLSAQDGALRSTSAGTAQVFGFTKSTIAVTQYAPYAMRAIAVPGRVNTAAFRAYINDGIAERPSSSVTSGLATLAIVAPSSSLTSVGVYNNGSGEQFGNYFDTHYVSLARCALVDNRPNLLLQSDDFTTTWTNVRSTDSGNLTTAPDGTLTGDAIIEDSTASNTHYVEQSATVASTVLDYAFGVALKQDALGWANIALGEATGATECSVYVNLASGAIGTIATGANWANVRVFAKSLGNDWWHFCIVARKTNAATSIAARIYTAAGDGVASYNGDGTSRFFAWRATLAQSSVPTRLSLTTISATTGTSQTGGNLHLKGLPASTSGLLLAGDPAEIILPSGSQFVRTTAPLNSDAASLGYWQFEPPLRASPADNAAVIVCRPMMRSLLDSNTVRWTERLGGFCDLEFSAVEDLT